MSKCVPHSPTHMDKWQNDTQGRSSTILFNFLGIPPINLVFFVMVLFVTSIRTCQQDCVLIVSRCIEAGVLGYTFGQLPPVLSCPISHVRKLWHSKMTKRKWNHLTAGVLSFQTHTSRRISHPHCIMGHNSFIFSLRAFRTWLHGDLHTESLWADASGPLIYHVSPHCHSVTKSFLLDMDPFGEGAVRAGVAAREGLCHLAPFFNTGHSPSVVFPPCRRPFVWGLSSPDCFWKFNFLIQNPNPGTIWQERDRGVETAFREWTDVAIGHTDPTKMPLFSDLSLLAGASYANFYSFSSA